MATSEKWGSQQNSWFWGQDIAFLNYSVLRKVRCYLLVGVISLAIRQEPMVTLVCHDSRQCSWWCVSHISPRNSNGFRKISVVSAWPWLIFTKRAFFPTLVQAIAYNWPNPRSYIVCVLSIMISHIMILESRPFNLLIQLMQYTYYSVHWTVLTYNSFQARLRFYFVRYDVEKLSATF